MNQSFRTNNILYNNAAMNVLREAAAKLEALGAHVILSPSGLHDGDMSVALHVALTDKAVVDSYCQTSLGADLAASECVERFTAMREYYLTDRQQIQICAKEDTETRDL